MDMSVQDKQTGFPFEKLVNSRTAATLIGVHYKTLERMARHGEVPALKLGKSWQFRLSMLSHWLDGQLKSNTNQVPSPSNRKEN
jgi:excisionase family DNA binding protein